VAKPISTREVVSLLMRWANEFSQTFEQRFPDAEIGYEIDGGMRKGEREVECQSCGRPTRWFHGIRHAHFCCEDCLLRFQSLDTP
jgi:hypothetical protein